MQGDATGSRVVTLLGCCGGGKGVYSFLGLSSLTIFLAGAGCFLNFGRKRSQLSFLRASSLDSSRLMSSSYGEAGC